jgi:sugar-specific transcriptional regulator TrmB
MKRAPSALQALGFSEIEALVYCYLLTNAPATGYKVSRGIGKPVANTYKAIADLKNRGVLELSAEDNKIATPVAPEELLRRLDGEFNRQREEAASELAKLSREPEDEHLYRLNSPQQVLDRARAMLEGARQILLLEAFPRFWEQLRPFVADAAGRGVKVLAKLYADGDLPGMMSIRPRDAENVLRMWPGERLSLVVDAAEHLTALGSKDLTRIHQAIWTNSVFISCTQHNYLWSEMVAVRCLETQGSRDAPAAGLTEFALAKDKPPGLKQLLERYREPSQTGAGGQVAKPVRRRNRERTRKS